MFPRLAPLVAAFCKPLVFAAAITPSDSNRTALLKDVAEITAPGVPGGVSAFGPQAFAVVAGKEGKKNLLPVIAATPWEKGRVVVFGHNGYLSAVHDPGTATLLVNAVKWLSANASHPKIAVVGQAELAAHLRSAGITVESLDARKWSERLTGFAAVCIDAHALRDTDVAPLQTFVRGGGGLLSAATGWGWLSGHKDKSLAAEFPGNRALAGSGLAWTAGTPDKTLPRGYSAGGDLTLLGASEALDATIAHTNGKAKLSADQLGQCTATLADALRAIPPEDKILLPKISALATSASMADLPRPDRPLTTDHAIARLLFTRTIEALRTAKPEQLHAHPAADFFPGLPPRTAPIIRNRTLTIDTQRPAWHSTGLYAAPGAAIRITVPPSAANAGLGIRIGCHTDSLWHLDKWQRSPEVSRREPIRQTTTLAGNPFGGLIYVDVPDNSALGVLSVTIDGAVEAPHYVHGKTSVSEWKSRIRNAPAPWAELETSKIILSVPSEKIRQLDDPDALMNVWDQVLDADADLLTIPRARKRPERIVPDTQISAGYMHSGYPIMTFLDKSVETSLSTTQMKQGSWGHFHELGHNHQQGEWTFDGTTEVTCNLFSLYVMETVCGREPGRGHDAMEPQQVAKRLGMYLRSPNFDRWKSDPFLALTMYHQLRVGFGWETYKKVFAEYRELPKSERPKNDDDERDQWMVRFSRAAGKNLGPFFQAWGVPTSDGARASIKDLPIWMPADWPQ